MLLDWMSGLPEFHRASDRVIGSLKAVGLGVVLAAGLAINPAAAADPTFNFKATTNSPEVGVAGNVRPYTSTPGGLGVSVSAYSSASGTGPLEKAYLGAYTPGLGVTNNVNASGTGTSDNSHTVDNSGSKDFVVFEFSRPLQAMTISLSAFGDTDMQVWTGNLGPGYNFSGANLSTLGGIVNQGTFLGSTSDRTVTFSNFSLANYLIVAALPSDRAQDDSFKIASLTVKAVPGPVAGAGLPALLALAGFVFMRRRAVA